MRDQVRNIYRALFARPACRRLNSALFYLALSGLGISNSENDEVSGESYLVRHRLKQEISNPRPVFFDVGANVGHYAALLLEQYPTAFVHAFEPHPKTYQRLVAHDFQPNRVKCHNAALGAAPGTLTLYDHAGDDGSEHASLHRETITGLYHDKTTATDVAVRTLDEVAEQEQVGYIDFLKIDTEGHELAVLTGAAKLLSAGRIGPIQFEFNALNAYSRVFFKDFRELLGNYQLYRLLPKGLLPLNDYPIFTELFAFQNVLALPTRPPGG